MVTHKIPFIFNGKMPTNPKDILSMSLNRDNSNCNNFLKQFRPKWAPLNRTRLYLKISLNDDFKLIFMNLKTHIKKNNTNIRQLL